jgi:hypothetical protein
MNLSNRAKARRAGPHLDMDHYEEMMAVEDSQEKVRGLVAPLSLFPAGRV